jgi:hypothetical protein
LIEEGVFNAEAQFLWSSVLFVKNVLDALAEQSHGATLTNSAALCDEVGDFSNRQKRKR